jgi:hypothetical protein
MEANLSIHWLRWKIVGETVQEALMFGIKKILEIVVQYV